MDEIKNEIATLMSGSGTLDITRVFVTISNGDGKFSDLDMEIRLEFKKILGAVFNKLEGKFLTNNMSHCITAVEKLTCFLESAFNPRNQNEFFGKSSSEDYIIPPNITTTDPSYRLLRLILFTANQETCVDAIGKMLTIINTPQGRSSKFDLLKNQRTRYRSFWNDHFESSLADDFCLDRLSFE